MRRLATLFILAAVVVAVGAGCSSIEDKPAITLTDNEGIVEPRVVTVGYVNGRLDRVPAEMVPDVPGDEGKREFMEEIIRKEVLVIYGTRIGALDDPRYPGAMVRAPQPSPDPSSVWQIQDDTLRKSPIDFSHNYKI